MFFFHSVFFFFGGWGTRLIFQWLEHRRQQSRGLGFRVRVSTSERFRIYPDLSFDRTEASTSLSGIAEEFFVMKGQNKITLLHPADYVRCRSFRIGVLTCVRKLGFLSFSSALSLVPKPLSNSYMKRGCKDLLI